MLVRSALPLPLLLVLLMGLHLSQASTRFELSPPNAGDWLLFFEQDTGALGATDGTSTVYYQTFTPIVNCPAPGTKVHVDYDYGGGTPPSSVNMLDILNGNVGRTVTLCGDSDGPLPTLDQTQGTATWKACSPIDVFAQPTSPENTLCGVGTPTPVNCMAQLTSGAEFNCTFDIEVTIEYEICFPASASVMAFGHDGVTSRKRMDELSIGDDVLCVEHGTGMTRRCPITTFGRAHSAASFQFLHIQARTSGGGDGGAIRDLKVTAVHYLWAELADSDSDGSNSDRAVRGYGTKASDTLEGFPFVPRGALHQAGDLRIGDTVFIHNDSNNNTDLEAATIFSIDLVTEQGAYSPVSETGLLLVDDIAVSSFAVEDPVRNYHIYAPFTQLARLGRLDEVKGFQIPAKNLEPLNIFPGGRNLVSEALITEAEGLAVDNDAFHRSVQKLIHTSAEITPETISSALHAYAA